jgi:hypothetical protein
VISGSSFRRRLWVWQVTLSCVAATSFICGLYLFERNGWGRYEIGFTGLLDNLLQWGALAFPAVWILVFSAGLVLLGKRALFLLISLPVAMMWITIWGTFMIYLLIYGQRIEHAMDGAPQMTMHKATSD